MTILNSKPGTPISLSLVIEWMVILADKCFFKIHHSSQNGSSLFEVLIVQYVANHVTAGAAHQTGPSLVSL